MSLLLLDELINDAKKSITVTPTQDRNDWDHYRQLRKEIDRHDESWQLTYAPIPLTAPTLSIEGDLQNKYLRLPNGTLEGCRFTVNHLTDDEAYAALHDPSLILN